jgi:hypothetical protein
MSMQNHKAFDQTERQANMRLSGHTKRIVCNMLWLTG